MDDASLWLPTRYQAHFEALKSAALTVKATEKCHHLLSGKLLTSRSSPEHLIFSFRCRTQERYSFSVEFDNNTQLISDPYDPFELKKEQNRLRRERQKAKRYKDICQQAMEERIEEFREPVILDINPVGPLVESGRTIYSLSFDSISSKDKTLHYKVQCKIKNDNDYQMKVSPRAEVMPITK